MMEELIIVNKEKPRSSLRNLDELLNNSVQKDEARHGMIKEMQQQQQLLKDVCQQQQMQMMREALLELKQQQQLILEELKRQHQSIKFLSDALQLH